MISTGDRSEIAFFDVETTIPLRQGQKYAILEFGSILVCPRTLVELESYSTLVKPSDLSLISPRSVQCNRIDRNDVVSAPSFSQIADRVYDILHGRIWAGHNINRFDCIRIRDAFADINRPAPEPKGTIDSLALLTQRFGRRAGDMKMASLATYFGLGQQSHRSLDDVRMNLEVLKYCATVLFLESSLPDVLTANSWVSPNVTTRSRSNEKASPEGMGPNESTPSSGSGIETHPRSSLAQSNIARADPLNMGSLRIEMERESLQTDDTVMESVPESQNLSTENSAEASGGCTHLKPDEISIPSIAVVLAQIYPGIQRLQILHKNTALRVCCSHLKVRFGISTKFVDHAGRPRLSFVVDASPDLCRVLDACDSLAQRMSLDSGSTSYWRDVVTRKAGFVNSPTIRLHLPTVPDGNSARWTTEIYHNDPSSTQRVVFSRYDVAEIDALLVPGTCVDAYFSINTYDYQHSAGIRLFAEKLILHSN